MNTENTNIEAPYQVNVNYKIRVRDLAKYKSEWWEVYAVNFSTGFVSLWTPGQNSISVLSNELEKVKYLR